MNQRILILVVSLWLIQNNVLSAQAVGFSLPTVNNITPGQNMLLPVSVTNFDSILSAQFVIRWNPQVLQFQSVASLNLPNLDPEDFGMTEAVDSGFIRFGWASPTDVMHPNEGTTVADGTVIFRLKMKAVGPDTSSTPVRFTELAPLTIFEVTKGNGQVFGYAPGNIPPVLHPGFVAIGYTVATHEAGNPDAFVRVSPNPFQASTQIMLTLEEASPVQLIVTDVAGRILLEKKFQLPAGQHGMEIASSQLREKGTYFMLCRTKSFSIAMPLFLN